MPLTERFDLRRIYCYQIAFGCWKGEQRQGECERMLKRIDIRTARTGEQGLHSPFVRGSIPRKAVCEDNRGGSAAANTVP